MIHALPVKSMHPTVYRKWRRVGSEVVLGIKNLIQMLACKQTSPEGEACMRCAFPFHTLSGLLGHDPDAVVGLQLLAPPQEAGATCAVLTGQWGIHLHRMISLSFRITCHSQEHVAACIQQLMPQQPVCSMQMRWPASQLQQMVFKQKKALRP